MTVSYLETGVLYCEDNLRQLAQFPDACVDLIYLDPPFFSNRHYEVIWGDEAEVRSFEDRWEGGIHVYINWMRDRVIQMRRILRPTGSFYLHCDSHASHYLKVMLDGVFGAPCFRNEIIWSYRRWPDRRARAFQRMHDSILFYSATADGPGTFNVACEEISSSSRKRFGGKRQILDPSTGTRKVTSEVDTIGLPRRDVWELPIIAGNGKERLGYPTQKPEALLERILAASSQEQDTVLDPFCGCGTTVAVAERMRRKWIGIDISPTAVQLMKQRLVKSTNGHCTPKVVGLPVTEADLRLLKPFEFQNWVIQKLVGTHSPRKSGDMGIDGWSYMVHDPIQVKQSESVGRNVVDNFETAMERVGKDKGYIVAFSFTKGAREEVARARWEKKLDIQLIPVGKLLAPDPEERGPLDKVPAAVLPLPPARPREARPSVEELIESDRSAG